MEFLIANKMDHYIHSQNSQLIQFEKFIVLLLKIAMAEFIQFYVSEEVI